MSEGDRVTGPSGVSTEFPTQLSQSFSVMARISPMGAAAFPNIFALYSATVALTSALLSHATRLKT